MTDLVEQWEQAATLPTAEKFVVGARIRAEVEERMRGWKGPGKKIRKFGVVINRTVYPVKEAYARCKGEGKTPNDYYSGSPHKPCQFFDDLGFEVRGWKREAA